MPVDHAAKLRIAGRVLQVAKWIINLWNRNYFKNLLSIRNWFQWFFEVVAFKLCKNSSSRIFLKSISMSDIVSSSFSLFASDFKISWNRFLRTRIGSTIKNAKIIPAEAFQFINYRQWSNIYRVIVGNTSIRLNLTRRPKNGCFYIVFDMER